MPAAGWAAKSGNPLLWVTAQGIPPETEAAIKTAQVGRRSTCSGPADAVPDTVLDALGSSARSSGSRAPTRSPTRSRSRATRTATFGWYVVDPGHGLVFASTRAARRTRRPPRRCRPRGTYGPLLLLTDAGVLPQPLQDYLLDIQPGYDADRSGPRRLQPWLDHRRRERASPPRCRRA